MHRLAIFRLEHHSVLPNEHLLGPGCTSFPVQYLVFLHCLAVDLLKHQYFLPFVHGPEMLMLLVENWKYNNKLVEITWSRRWARRWDWWWFWCWARFWFWCWARSWFWYCGSSNFWSSENSWWYWWVWWSRFGMAFDKPCKFLAMLYFMAFLSYFQACAPFDFSKWTLTWSRMYKFTLTELSLFTLFCSSFTEAPIFLTLCAWT